MALFGFGDQYAMFDATPVENLFIQEYMLRADGDFVKVYLYGLMQCYHPVGSASIATVARDLQLDEARVENAFGYWERLGLVRRVGDNPVSYVFMNLKQIELMRSQGDDGLYRYADFNNSLQSLFGADRLLHPQDFEKVYDWIEGLGLPQEVVLMLVSDYIRRTGKKKFLFKSLDKTAREWAEAGIRTIADAEERTRQGGEQALALKQVYKKLGKRHAPSEPDEAMYLKWTREWGFDLPAILEACEETTKGSPTMGYVDGILRRFHGQGLHTAKEIRTGLIDQQALDDRVKKLLSEMGFRGTGPTDDSRALYRKFVEQGFSEETIALAAQRVARKRGTLDALEKTLGIWREAGVFGVEAARAYLAKHDARPSRPSKEVAEQRYTQRDYTDEELNTLIADI